MTYLLSVLKKSVFTNGQPSVVAYLEQAVNRFTTNFCFAAFKVGERNSLMSVFSFKSKFLEQIKFQNGFNNLLFEQEIEFQYTDFRLVSC